MDDNHDDHDSLISSFASFTGQDPDRSKLYLESTGWNLDLAIQTFYEEGDEIAAAAEQLPRNQDEAFLETEESVAAEPAVPLSLAGLLAAGQSSSLGFNNPAAASMSDNASSSSGAKKKKAPAPRGGIATLNTLKQQEEEEDGSSDEEGQAFYAGGSERSGQQILGPNRSKKDSDQVVAEMFKAAKEHGGEAVDPSQSAPKRPAPAFRGSGFRLGSEVGEPSSTVPSGPNLELPQPVDMCLRLWRNGFTVDDGELRTFDDPTNAEFLTSIKSGHIPRELVMMAKGSEVSLNMEDHRHEDFVAQKKKSKPFSGEGQRLGAVAPTVETVAPGTSSVDDEAAARQELNVSESNPVTSIQIRLADSSRLVIKLNLTHTVSQVRQFICRARPSHAARPFSLMTTFPNKELTDDKLTIEEASLANAVIVQRFT